MSREALGIASYIGAAVVGEPFDRLGEAVHGTEAMLDGSAIRSRTPSAVMPPVVAMCPMASRSQQSSAKATRTFSPLSQPISDELRHNGSSAQSSLLGPARRESRNVRVPLRVDTTDATDLWS